jgi:hypothetical protein
MTVPSVPPVMSPPTGQLRQVEHPDLSPLLTRFCGQHCVGTGVPSWLAWDCALSRVGQEDVRHGGVVGVHEDAEDDDVEGQMDGDHVGQ